ncbi:MAG: hypothetical protein ACFFCS_20230 [Candidatus Hodarchaeota archaeon]
MLFLTNPEATNDALAILRDGTNFQWYVIFMLVAVLFIYFSEVNKKNFRGIAAGLLVYMIHWLAEIINALIQAASGHALWTVPKGTSFLILIGVGIELSLMFSIAGLAMSRLLSDDPKKKILKLPAPLFIGLFNAALASGIEIFLVMTPAFVWIYEWWNALTVFVFVYIPFFVVGAYGYYWKPKKQKYVILVLLIIIITMLVIFGGIMGII